MRLDRIRTLVKTHLLDEASLMVLIKLHATPIHGRTICGISIFSIASLIGEHEESYSSR